MALTVGQLKAQLADYPDEAVIVMQGDDEGNSYKYLRGIEYIAEGDGANYFLTVEGDEVCWRKEDLEMLEISKRKWGKPVAVAF